MLHTLVASSVLDQIRAARAGRRALPGLEPDAYARAHAAFEARSDQRSLITADLSERLAARSRGPLSVLSVGCGDGTLDATLAAGAWAVRPSRPVRWTGVDPHVPSMTAFRASLDGLRRDGLTVDTRMAAFAEARLEVGFDVVTFVHSMYYVADVAATLRAAHALLRPSGEMLVLSAPLAGMNALADALAPPVDGHPQWFSENVAAGFAEAGLRVDMTTIEARADLADADDEVLDFTVQARLDDDLRALVRAYLGAIADVDGLVPHLVDVHRCLRD